MVWDFAEANPFSEASGGFLGGMDWISKVLSSQSLLSAKSNKPLQQIIRCQKMRLS